MKTKLQLIFEQWQNNARLRLGIWLIITILLFTLVLDLRDRSETRYRQLTEVLKKNMQVRAIVEDRQWLERRDQFAALRQQIDSGLLKAQTIGLAQADIRTLVERLLQEEGIKLEIINVAVPQPASFLPGCYSVNVSLQGSLPLYQLFSLLYRLESAKYIVAVDNFLLRPNNRQNFSLECRFFVKLNEK